MNAAPLLKLEQLNAEQQEAVRLIRSKGNIVVSGAAGTGKSVLLRYLSENLSNFHITASTGIAALNVGGCTIHSWASLGVGQETAKQIAKKLLDKRNATWYSICRAEAIAIDEVSMISADLFDMLDEVLRLVRKSDRPFGGMQVINFGDFCQLPPVGDKGKAARFAFESKAWAAGNFRVVMLKKVMRQENELFASVLSRVRLGDTSDDVRDVLRPRVNAVDPDPTIKPVVLMTHNADADAENIQSLMRLEGKEWKFEARDWAISDFQYKAIDRDCIAPKTLLLRKGAQVMLLWNMLDIGLANGSVGIVEDVIERDEPIPVVRFMGFPDPVEIEPRKWKTTRHGEEIATRKQIPLRLAYAITIHKCQGMSLDKCEVSLSKCFAPGQAYVALSRARTLDGLFIRDIKRHSITAHPDALSFYRKHAAE